MVSSSNVSFVRGLAVWLGLLLIGPGSLPSQVSTLSKSHGEETFFVNWKSYPDYERMTEILKGLAKKFPDRARLFSSGKSRQGRELWVMEITRFDNGDPMDKPGFYVDGNIHGNEVNGMMVPLYTAWFLLTRYGYDPFVTRLVDRLVFYVRPSVNPDAMNSFIDEPNTQNSPRWNFRPIDNDGDGTCDEDPEEDLNGDGEISLMRRRDPSGKYRISPDDPRLLIAAKPGELAGGWTLLGTEGVDNDNDGRLNEDPPGGLDLARNFPYDFSVQNGWPYPLSEPETRAVLEFFRAHPHIAGVFHFHNSGKLIMMAMGTDVKIESTLPSEFAASPLGPLPEMTPAEMKLMDTILKATVEQDRMRDVAMYRMLAARGVRLLGYETAHNRGAGQFTPWAYAMQGIPSFLIELWGIPADYNGDGRISDKEALRWVDEELHGEGWTDWKPYSHPQFGPVEIGGTNTRFVRRTPPVQYLEEHCFQNTQFLLHVASELPCLTLSKARFVPIFGFSSSAAGDSVLVKESVRLNSSGRRSGKGILGWLDLEIRNTGIIPTATAQAVKIKALSPDRLILSGSQGVRILGRAESISPLGLAVDFKADTSHIVDIGHLLGRSWKNACFLLQIESEKEAFVTVDVKSVRGGRMTERIPIRFSQRP